MAILGKGAGMRVAIAALGAGLLAGCVSTKPYAGAGMPVDGFQLGRPGRHAVMVMRRGPPLWVVYSGFHIPKGDGQVRFEPVRRCADARVKVRLGRGIREGGQLVADICTVALQTLDYLDREAGRIDLRVRMHVVSEGREASRRTIAVGLAPRVSLAVPMHEDRQRLLTYVIDIIAHEGSHLVDGALGSERALTVDGEVQAYRHALCAQLEITGQLHRSGVPLLPMVETGSESTDRTIRGGVQVLQETAPLFDGKYYVLAGTPAADTIMQRCRQGEAGARPQLEAPGEG